MRVEEFDGTRDTWNTHVVNSEVSNIFHKHEILKLIEKHSNANLHMLIGLKGQEPFGALPLFQIPKRGLNTIRSPPSGMGIANLGPFLINYDKLKTRKKEKRLNNFVDQCIKYFSENIGPKYIEMKVPIEFDPRPFGWHGFDVSPLFLYSLDITGDPDELLMSFTRDLRSAIQSEYQPTIDIYVGGEQEIEFIYEQIRKRYNTQDRIFPIPFEFIKELYHTLGESHVKPYVASVDGELQAGTLVLQHFDEVRFWQGGGKPDLSLPLNDLIHWKIIQDAKKIGVSRYNLEGANTPRICSYKSKFSPDRIAFYTVRRHSKVSRLYSALT